MRAPTFIAAMAALLTTTAACGTDQAPPAAGQERHLANILQLTDGG